MVDLDGDCGGEGLGGELVGLIEWFGEAVGLCVF